MNDDVIIKVDGLSKRYGLPLLPSLRDLVNNLRKNKESISIYDGSWALRDISFEVKRGETLGIIGRNGAGKSTLLKILAGITPPTRGRIEVRGEVFPMIELNAGIHHELTGRENVRLLGAIMGLSRQEVEAKIPAIEEFTELGEWFNQPVRKYSSGMLARLGFGVAMNVDADILLIDEVLAVGDVAFQQKCYNHLFRLLRSRGITILFVSHAYRQVERLCDSALFLDKGAIISLGTCQAVMLEYMNHVQEIADQEVKRSQRIGTQNEFVSVTNIGVVFPEIDGNNQAYSAQPLVLEISYQSKLAISDAYFFLQIFTQDGVQISAITSRGQAAFKLQPGVGSVTCEIPQLNLLPGVYLLNAGIGRHQFYQKLDRGGLQVPLRVIASDLRYYNIYAGLFIVEARWGGHRIIDDDGRVKRVFGSQ